MIYSSITSCVLIFLANLSECHALIFKLLFYTLFSDFPFSIQSHHSRPSQNSAEDVTRKTKTDQVGFAFSPLLLILTVRVWELFSPPLFAAAFCFLFLLWLLLSPLPSANRC